MSLEESLSDIAADLVEFEENSLFLKRLFSVEAAKWLDVTHLCSGLIKVEDQLRELQKSMEGTFWVTWLDHPNSESGKGYCLIVFYSDELDWSSIALYNKQAFSQKFAS